MKDGIDIVNNIYSALGKYERDYCCVGNTCDNCIFSVGTTCLNTLIKDTLSIMNYSKEE